MVGARGFRLLIRDGEASELRGRRSSVGCKKGGGKGKEWRGDWVAGGGWVICKGGEGVRLIF